MTASLCLWLAEWEAAVWRMTIGVFRFTFYRLPEWLVRTLIETVGPAVIRLIRVFIALSVWLTVVFGPVVPAVVLNGPFWLGGAAAVWVTMALAGSVWGLYRLKKRRAKAVVPVAAVPITGVPPSKPPVARLLPPTRPAANFHKV